MEQSKFFNSTADDIREYNANDYAEYFEKSYGNGVYREGEKLTLRCTNTGLDMNTSIDLGSAMIKGYMYSIKEASLTLTHDIADPTYDRIDRVVLRLDLNDNAKYIKAFVLKGVPSELPVAPTLTRNNLVYELSLGQVLIKANSSAISKVNIKDERLDTNVCGVVHSNLDSRYVNLMDYTSEVTVFDENENPTEVCYYTSSGTLFEKTSLSNRDVNNNYTTLKIYKYLEDEVTVGHIKEYKLTYNTNDTLIKKELVVS